MKKIMFKDKFGLTDAVLQGRKTMTRRLCKEFRTGRIIYSDEVESVSMYSDENLVEFVMKDGSIKVSVPPYKPGDIVAVAQSYKDAGIDPHFLMFQPIKGSTCFTEMEIEAMFTGGWNNKMFVRPDLMPHRIRITDMKIERLQDISDEDCLKEGVTFNSTHWIMGYEVENLWNKFDRQSWFRSARCAFSALIAAVSGKGTWERNPYTFAYTFNSD